MDRFALLDIETGYVVWIGDAPSPADACQAAAVSSGREVGTPIYTRRAHNARPDAGYIAFKVPPLFAVDDGMDAESVARVMELELIGYYALQRE